MKDDISAQRLKRISEELNNNKKKYAEWRTETGVLKETLKFMDSEPRFFQYDHIGSY